MREKVRRIFGLIIIEKGDILHKLPNRRRRKEKEGKEGRGGEGARAIVLFKQKQTF